MKKIEEDKLYEVDKLFNNNKYLSVKNISCVSKFSQSKIILNKIKPGQILPFSETYLSDPNYQFSGSVISIKNKGFYNVLLEGNINTDQILKLKISPQNNPTKYSYDIKIESESDIINKNYIFATYEDNCLLYIESDNFNKSDIIISGISKSFNTTHLNMTLFRIHQ